MAESDLSIYIIATSSALISKIYVSLNIVKFFLKGKAKLK